MHAEHATAESPKLDLPEDLVTEVNRRGGPRKTDFRVEGWKPSLFGRLVERLMGKSAPARRG
jgi:hypothetical protein